MRYWFLLSGLVIGFVLSYGFRAGGERAPATDACVHDAATFRCVKFDHNYDGDTITVQIPNVPPIIGKNISVRVYGIDTPEMKGKLPCEKDRAKEARDLVHSLLSQAKHIELRQVQRDKYFRILAEVVADGVSLREKLLERKLAYPYGGGTKDKTNWCELAKRS